MKYQQKIILLVWLVMGNLQAQAESYTSKLDFVPEFNFFMQVGAQTGGDGTEPLPLYYRGDGAYYTGIPYRLVGNWRGVNESLPQTWEDEVEAGGLYKFAIGVEIPILDNVSILTSFGYQFDEVFGDLTDGSGGKGSIVYTRRTLEFIPAYSIGRHRIGLGGVFHYQPKAFHREYSSNFNLKTTYRFNDAFGAALQYDYKVTENASLGVKLTKIAYDFDNLSTRYVTASSEDIVEASCTQSCEDIVNADSIGVHLTYQF